jgi:hypothetical protein
MRIARYLLLLILFISLGLSAQAQCCSAGNPLFFTGEAMASKHELKLSLGYKYGYADTYYNEDDHIDIDFLKKAFFNYMNFSALYGVTERIGLQMDLGYFISKNEVYRNPSWDPERGYGLGDMSLKFNYLAYKSFKKKFSLQPFMGIRIPVGVFDQEVNGVKLPITVQPSSGSFRYFLGMVAEKQLPDPKWSLSLLASYEYAQRIDSRNFYYKYGNTVMASVLASYALSPKVGLALQAGMETRGRSMRENDQRIESTGYLIVPVTPHLSYSFHSSWILALNAEIPVYRFYNGIQIGNQLMTSVRLSYAMRLRKETPEFH